MAAVDAINGALKAVIQLSDEAGRGIEYHEGFHYVSLLLLDKTQRKRIYDEYRSISPDYANMSDKAVEEALAEEFRQYMLNNTRPGLKYRIMRFFRNMMEFIKGMFVELPARNRLYSEIAKGTYRNMKPSQDVLQEFSERYSDGAFFYVPGVSRKALAKLENISSADQYYSIVNALNNTALSAINITSINDINNININSLFDELEEALAIGAVPEGSVGAVEDVLNNRNLFAQSVKQYLAEFSINVKDKLETEEDATMDQDAGDNSEEQFDKTQGSISKKLNVALQAKLLLHAIPSYKRNLV
jgi:hypothetical protein